ncbi:MAG: dihydroorotase, partial [Gemmatirosa sp.]
MSAPARRPVLLTGGRVLDPSQGLDLAVGDVLLLDGKVEHAGERVARPDDAEVVDCAGLVVS